MTVNIILQSLPRNYLNDLTSEEADLVLCRCHEWRLATLHAFNSNLDSFFCTKYDFLEKESSLPSNYFQMLLKNKVNSTYLHIHENEDVCIQQTTHFCQKTSHCHIRKVVIEGMACQLPSSQEVWRKLLQLLYSTLVSTQASFFCGKNMLYVIVGNNKLCCFSTKKRPKNFMMPN